MTITTTNQNSDDDIIATTLLNVTIMAADRRGGRRMLSVDDYKAFQAMLMASDGIRPAVQHEQEVSAVTQSKPEQQDAAAIGMDAVAKAIGSTAATLAPNAL
ncbi:hypothetical protein ABIB86_000407 [Bradyrhizobium sp. JR1.7]|uniref:hypothetical protein n=1 Tax=unclassified Bradyrhizobium TaxID=2631580 RepID=UPI003392DC44